MIKISKTFVVTLAVLATLRLSIAAAIERYVNRALDRHSDYAGHVGNVRLNLWRGAYVIEELKLLKREGESTEPFIAASSVDLSIHWSALLHGELVGEITFNQPEMNFVLGSDPAGDQTRIDADWRKTLLALFPFKIDQIQLRDGKLRFRDLAKQPPIDIELADVDARLRNLTNVRDREPKSESGSEPQLATTLEAVGRPFGAGSFWLELKLDPFAARPTFDLDAAIEGLDLVRLNDFLRGYAGLDVERGTFHAFFELASADGRITGYVKPFFEDLEVVAAREVETVADLPHAAYEAAAGAAAQVLANPSTGQVATKIPIEGRIEAAETNVWATIGTLLRNAFVRALNPGIEGSITVGDAEKEKAKGEEKKSSQGSSQGSS